MSKKTANGNGTILGTEVMGLSAYTTNALKIGLITAAVTLLGITAIVSDLTKPWVGAIPSISLGVGVAAATSVYLVDTLGI